MIIFINSLTVIIALYFARFPKRSNILHPKKIFLWFFVLVQVSGFYFIEIIKRIDQQYKISDASLLSVSIITLGALILFLFFYYLLTPLDSLFFKKIKLPKIKPYYFKSFGFIFLIIGLTGLTIYYLNSGFVLFRSGDYQNKNFANVGLGFARIMYGYGFSFAIMSFLAIDYSRTKSLISIVGSIPLGVLIFIIIGGGRASALGLLMLILIIGIYYNKINYIKLIISGLLLFTLVLILVLIRNRIGFSSDNISLILYQIQGSFSPVDSFARIYENIMDQHKYNPSLFLNSFLTLIPRSIWTSKPLEIQVASVYFTKDILKYITVLTISPTLLGELFIYWGYNGIIIGMFICALLVKTLSAIYQKSARYTNMKIFIILNALYAFSLFREGLSIALRDIFLFSIIFFIMAIGLEVFFVVLIKPDR